MAKIGISAVFDYAPSIFENAGLEGQTTTLLATVFFFDFFFDFF